MELFCFLFILICQRRRNYGTNLFAVKAYGADCINFPDRRRILMPFFMSRGSMFSKLMGKVPGIATF